MVHPVLIIWIGHFKYTWDYDNSIMNHSMTDKYNRNMNFKILIIGNANTFTKF